MAAPRWIAPPTKRPFGTCSGDYSKTGAGATARLTDPVSPGTPITSPSTARTPGGGRISPPRTSSPSTNSLARTSPTGVRPGGARRRLRRRVAGGVTRRAPARPRAHRRHHPLDGRPDRQVPDLGHPVPAQVAPRPGLPDRGRRARHLAARGPGRLDGHGGRHSSGQAPARYPGRGEGLRRLRAPPQGPGGEDRRRREADRQPEGPVQPFLLKMGARDAERVYSYRVDWDQKVA